LANTQVDYQNPDGTWTAHAYGAANESATITIGDPGAGGMARIHKVTASFSGATAAADVTLIISPDASTSSWVEYMGAVRGPAADRNFNQPIICKPSTAPTIVLDAAGGTSISHVSAVYDYKK